MAHIQKRNNSYVVRYRDPANRERSQSFSGKGAARDAKNFSSTIETRLITGQWTDPTSGSTPFRLYSASWLAAKRVEVSERTLINIEGRLNNHVLPRIGAVPINRIRPLDVRNVIGDLTESGLAPATVTPVYNLIAQVFQQAVIDGLLVKTPCVGIKLPKTRHREEMLFLDAAQVNTLADTINPRYRTMIYTAAYAGLRAGEIAALRIGRVNPLAATIEVVSSLGEVRGRIVEGPTKTGRPRTITIPRFLAEMIGEQL